MARFCGVVGFEIQVETAADVWEPIASERVYYGDVLAAKKRTERGEGLNDDFSLSNRVSIVADPYAEDHLSEMRYVVIRGTKWKITEREVQYPRIILNIGGVYNGQTD